jgi:acyl-coenzyme A synthetase/AMP-(fatty) acid ligase
MLSAAMRAISAASWVIIALLLPVEVDRSHQVAALVYTSGTTGNPNRMRKKSTNWSRYWVISRAV